MSSVYATEPASSGKVLFETTHGPLEIQLWCRECPTITKLFLQLCMDGFYDGMIFHRIVPDFSDPSRSFAAGQEACWV
jgi:peptidyl-prolyl cis-trans isomerase SDCCAG10